MDIHLLSINVGQSFKNGNRLAMCSAGRFVLAVELLHKADLIHDANASNRQLSCSIAATVLELLIKRDRLLIRRDRFVVLSEPLTNVAHTTSRT